MDADKLRARGWPDWKIERFGDECKFYDSASIFCSYPEDAEIDD